MTVFRAWKTPSSDTHNFGRVAMKNDFPHHIYVAALLVLAAGAFAMTIGIVLGEPAVMQQLLNAFLSAFSVGVLAVIGYAVHAKLGED
jgi:hypothetical protein